jgi:hypothetical protein
VYFVSEVLTGSKKFYSKKDKNCYAVIMSARKLRHYFEAHTIKVLTNQSLNDIFGNKDSSGRISKWAMELSEYVIDFEKCSTIKSQTLADFVAEWMEPGSTTEGPVLESPWLVYCDGAWGIVVLWFLTRFESRGAHGCGGQWNTRDTRVYIGLDLREDKNPTSCVHQLYYDSLG